MSDTAQPKARWNRGARSDWATPDSVFLPLNEEFRFTLDAAASPDNAKCARFFTTEDDGLVQPWTGEVVWCNPPYGRDRLAKWVERGRRAAAHEGAIVVMLVPAYTATVWWHVHTPHAEVRLLRGKIRFVGAKQRAMFASAVLVFRPRNCEGAA